MSTNALEAAPRPAPFDAVAETYDDQFTDSLIGRAQRQAVWRELDRAFRPGDRVLELNCGTGVDALYLASRGVEVLACDSSARMIEVASQRLRRAGGALLAASELETESGAGSSALRTKLRAPVRFEVLATEEIGTLRGSVAPFDGAFSNFAGLNCVEDLAAVSRDLAALLKPGARMVLCLFGTRCVWESLWYLVHGQPRKAFRRMRSAGDVANLGDGATVLVRYPSVRALRRLFSPEFQLKAWKGVGVAVPPSYVEPLARRSAGVLGFLVKLDRCLASVPFMRGLGDHVVLVFERV